MDDSHDGNKDDGFDLESPPDASAATTAAATSSNKHVSAEPPRWRFVSDAKKTSGYSTLAAGQHVQGKSSEELAAKYVAPDVSLYKSKGERPEVGRLQFPNPTGSSSKELAEVGKLKRDEDVTGDEDKEDNDKPEEGEGEGKEEESSAVQCDVPEKTSGENDESEPNADDGTRNFVESKDGGENAHVTRSSGHDEESQPHNPRGDEGVKESGSGSDSVAPSKEQSGDKAKKERQKRKQIFLYNVIILLLMVVILMGVLLGKRTPSVGEESVVAENQDVLSLASVVKNTTISPSGRPTTVPSILSPNPSEQLSASPSENPSLTPTKAPTDQPSDAPSAKPSSQPTPPLTQIPTSKPTCSPDPKPFSLCLAINMSGSLCNGRTGALCIGCPSILQSSDSRESYCRDTTVAWSSCCSNFVKVKEWATLIVNSMGNLPVEKSFSVVQFASDARIVSWLSSTAQTLSTIGQLTYSGGLDNHAGAIQMCQQTLSTSPYEKKIIVLMTDGETGMPDHVPKGSTESAATSAKGGGMFLFPVLVPQDPPDTNVDAIPMFSGISSSGEVFDFAGTGGVPNVSEVQKGILNHVSCSRG